MKLPRPKPLPAGWPRPSTTCWPTRQSDEEMGLKARQRVQEKFSWHQIARQTVEFYREIAGLGKA